MKFDKSRVYTAVNADELKIGSMVFLDDNLQSLKNDVFNNSSRCILDEIRTEEASLRFVSDGLHYSLAYLIEPLKEPKYKPFSSMEKAMEVIMKHGGWVKSKNGDVHLIICYAVDNVLVAGKHIVFYEDLLQYFVFADDGTPCGELVEE